MQNIIDNSESLKSLYNLVENDQKQFLKNFKDEELVKYLDKIKTEILLAYGVYQVEADGLDLFEYIKGDHDSIMGLPIKQIMN